MIPFNKPPYTGHEDEHVLAALRSGKLCGDGDYTRRCQAWFEARTGCARALLTPSCTHALELAALLLDIQPGDEVIMPSYTFVSTANAFVLRGARIVFVDIRPDTMNIDERLIEQAITPRTKAIVPVHYAGVGCEMDTIMAIAEQHGLFVVEDAAQGMMASYNGRPLGTIGHLGTYSFHETKNYTSGGEGGLLLINDPQFASRAEILREKGTNRSQFFRGMVDKYTWVDTGSSYLASELQAAYLYGQLQLAEEILADRLKTWAAYQQALAGLSPVVATPQVPSHCQHNAHMFYLKLPSLAARDQFIESLKQDRVAATFHYVPLHSAPFGQAAGRFAGVDRYTTQESERLVRLPLWYGMSDQELDTVLSGVSRALADQ